MLVIDLQPSPKMDHEHFDTAVEDMCAIFRGSRLRKDIQVARHAKLITALLSDEA